MLFAASCLEYGHSCWGAHGKRSSSPAMLVDGRSFPALKDLKSEQKLMNKEIDGIDESHVGSISAKKRFYEHVHDNNNEHGVIGDNERIVQLNKHSSLRNILIKHNSNIISRSSLDLDNADTSRVEENPRDESVEWYQTRTISGNRGQQVQLKPIWEHQRLYQRQHLKRPEQPLVNRKDVNEIYFDYES